MKIVIRVDSSYKIGSGHLMRCLTLSDGLYERGCKVSFLCRELPGNMIGYVEANGYKVHRLQYLEERKKELSGDLNYSDWLGVDWQTDAEETKSIIEKDGCTDWLIVDNYALDRRWEEQMHPFVQKIMVIDDLADRPHDCDLLLDQNLYEDMDTRYTGLVNENCKKFLGPRYALLRREFIEARNNLRDRDGNVKRILIFFGAADPTNETAKAVEAIKLIDRADIAVDVVVGTNNPHKNQIQALCYELMNVNYHCHVSNMAELMADADLSIGASGTTTWERCCVGLPSLVMIIAENQIDIAESLDKSGIVINLGWHKDIRESDLKNKLEILLRNPDEIKIMSVRARKIVDGRGVERVVRKTMKYQ